MCVYRVLSVLYELCAAPSPRIAYFLRLGRPVNVLLSSTITLHYSRSRTGISCQPPVLDLRSEGIATLFSVPMMFLQCPVFICLLIIIVM